LQIQEWPWNFGYDKSDSSLSTKWNIGIWENPEGNFIESVWHDNMFSPFDLNIFILFFQSNICIDIGYFSFQSNRRTIMDDPFIRNYIEDLLKNIRTQVLLKLIKPYTRIRIPFISKVDSIYNTTALHFNFNSQLTLAPAQTNELVE